MNKYTRESVKEILSQNNKVEMLKKYTKAELTEMHIAVYKCNPRSTQNKESILNEIIGYYSYMERNTALINL